MKKQNFIGKVLVVIIAAMFAAYLGYQLYVTTGEKTKTIDAVSVEAVDKISSEGVFLREQTPIEWKAKDMSEALVKDGEKVSKNQSVALVFQDVSSRESYAKYREVLSRYAALKNSESYLTDNADGAKLSLLIKSSVSDFETARMKRDVAKMNDSMYQLKSLVELQSSNISSKEQYDAEMAQVSAEMNKYSKASFQGQAVRSPKSGYFFSYSDGFDENFLPSNIEKLTGSDIEETIKNKESLQNHNSGKVVFGFEWYYAAVVTDDEAKKIKDSTEISLKFPNISSTPISVNVARISKDSENKNVVVFKSTQMSSGVLAGRCQQSEIILGRYKGIKIPKNSIRQEAGKWGVYCLVGEKAIFKEVQWIFETDSYYLVKQASSADKGLYEYDKIILSSKLIEKQKK